MPLYSLERDMSRDVYMKSDLLDDGLEEGREVIGKVLRRAASDAVHAAGIHHREVALLIGRAQLAEEVEGGVDDKVRPADAALTLLPPSLLRSAGAQRMFSPGGSHCTSQGVALPAACAGTCDASVELTTHSGPDAPARGGEGTGLGLQEQQEHLAAGRSILLTTTMTFFSMPSALRSTKRVCGIGPSTESTSSSTPAHHHALLSALLPAVECAWCLQSYVRSAGNCMLDGWMSCTDGAAASHSPQCLVPAIVC